MKILNTAMGSKHFKIFIGVFHVVKTCRRSRPNARKKGNLQQDVAFDLEQSKQDSGKVFFLKSYR